MSGANKIDGILEFGRFLARAAAAPALILALAAGPALAQKVPVTPPPTETIDAFTEGLDWCLSAAADLVTTQDDLATAGWTIDEAYETGPYIYTVSASRQVGDADLYFYASAELYPTFGLVYCTFEIDGFAGALDFGAVAAEFGLEGMYEVLPEGTYGTWELVGETDGVFILASLEEGYFWLQVNWLGLGTEGGAGGGGAK